MAVSSSSGEGSLLEDLLEVEGAPAAAGGRTRPRDPAVAQALAARDLNAEGGPGRFAHVHGADAKAVVPGRLCSLCGQRPQPLGWEQEKTSALLFLRKRNRELEASNEALKENLGAWRDPAGERQRMHARAAATGDRAVAIFLRAWDRLRLQRAFAALLRYSQRGHSYARRRRVNARLDRLRLRMAFRRFEAQIREHRRERFRLSKAAKFLLQTSFSTYWTAWRQHWQHNAKLRSIYGRILKRGMAEEQARVGRLLEEWKALSLAKADARRIGAWLGRQDRTTLVKFALQAWRNLASQRLRVLRKFAAKFRQSNAREVLERWREAARRGRYLRQKVRDHAAKRAHAAYRRYLGRWRGWMVRTAMLNMKERNVLRMREAKLQAQCLREWAAGCREGKHLSVVERRLKVALGRHLKRDAFEAFVHNAARARLAKRFARKLRNLKLARAFSTWRARGLEFKHQAQISKFALRKMAKALVQACFVHWACATQRARRAQAAERAGALENRVAHCQREAADGRAEAAEWRARCLEANAGFDAVKVALAQSQTAEGLRVSPVEVRTAGLACGGPSPSARGAHAACGFLTRMVPVVGRNLPGSVSVVVSGGFDLTERTNDFHVLSVAEDERDPGKSTCVWTPMACISDTTLGPRSDHGICRVSDTEFLVVGGFNGKKELGDVHLITASVNRNEQDTVFLGYEHVQLEAAAGGGAYKRSHFSLSECAHGIFACVAFGGYGNGPGGLFNDLWGLNTQSKKWEEILTHGDVPTARRNHAAVPVGGVLYLFGGADRSGNRNDLYRLDLQTWGWKRLACSGAVPGPRRQHAMCAQGPRHLLCHGGFDDGFLDDLYCLDLETLAWTQLRVAAPVACCLHSVFSVGSKVCTFGGIGEGGALDAVHVLYGLGPVSGEDLKAAALEATAAAADCKRLRHGDLETIQTLKGELKVARARGAFVEGKCEEFAAKLAEGSRNQKVLKAKLQDERDYVKRVKAEKQQSDAALKRSRKEAARELAAAEDALDRAEAARRDLQEHIEREPERQHALRLGHKKELQDLRLALQDAQVARQALEAAAAGHDAETAGLRRASDELAAEVERVGAKLREEARAADGLHRTIAQLKQQAQAADLGRQEEVQKLRYEMEYEAQVRKEFEMKVELAETARLQAEDAAQEAMVLAAVKEERRFKIEDIAEEVDPEKFVTEEIAKRVAAEKEVFQLKEQLANLGLVLTDAEGKAKLEKAKAAEALKVRDEALAYAKGVQGQLLAQYDVQRAEALQEGLASHALEEEEGDEGAAGAE